jgi:hypothetical protein
MGTRSISTNYFGFSWNGAIPFSNRAVEDAATLGGDDKKQVAASPELNISEPAYREYSLSTPGASRLGNHRPSNSSHNQDEVLRNGHRYVGQKNLDYGFQMKDRTHYVGNPREHLCQRVAFYFV